MICALSALHDQLFSSRSFPPHHLKVWSGLDVKMQQNLSTADSTRVQQQTAEVKFHEKSKDHGIFKSDREPSPSTDHHLIQTILTYLFCTDRLHLWEYQKWQGWYTSKCILKFHSSSPKAHLLHIQRSTCVKPLT